MSTTAIAVAPFGVEAFTQNSGDLIVQSIPGCRLRGRIDASRPATDRNGEDVLPESRTKLSRMGIVPGMELHVNPSKCTYKIRDPLHGDEEMCERVGRKLHQLRGGRNRGTPVRGVPPRSGTLDENRMKTLVRELMGMVDAGHAKLVRGDLPQPEDVVAMPGRFLLNPGSTIQNGQPLFEDDFSDWYKNLSRQGG